MVVYNTNCDIRGIADTIGCDTKGPYICFFSDSYSILYAGYKVKKDPYHQFIVKQCRAYTLISDGNQL